MSCPRPLVEMVRNRTGLMKYRLGRHSSLLSVCACMVSRTETNKLIILLRFISGNSLFYNKSVRLVTSKCTAVYTGPLVSVRGLSGHRTWFADTRLHRYQVLGYKVRSSDTVCVGKRLSPITHIIRVLPMGLLYSTYIRGYHSRLLPYCCV